MRVRFRDLKTLGFTLIELLVVIAIIGLLASFVTANLQSARMKARNSQRVQNLLQVQNALELYASEHDGLYPPLSIDNSAGLECWECSPSATHYKYDATKMASHIWSYLNPRPSDPLLPSGGRFGDGVPIDNRGLWYQVNSNRTAYKILIFDTVEIPGKLPNADITPTLLSRAGIPARFMDLNFLETPKDASISVASSDESKAWVWYSIGPGGDFQ